MENYDGRTEIIKAILVNLDIANELAVSTKKILIGFLSHIEVQDQIKILDDLKNRNIIGGFEKRTDFFAILEPSKSLLLDELERQRKKTEISKPLLVQVKSKPVPLPIKDIKIDASNYMIEINNGEKFLSFKSKKGASGLDKETKAFKILYHLWDFRWEMKNNKILLKGDFASLENLKRGTGCKTNGAVQQHIKRLNGRFWDEGLSIEISGENGKHRLVINKV